MFEQAFKNIDDILWKEAGCTTELDYTEQTSWLLFLKYLDGLEQDKADEAALDGKKYTYILDKPYRWESWAAPQGKNGQLDHNRAMTGDDLRLDEAFAGIATAKTNAEKNLPNARALCESHLHSVFAEHGPGRKATTLGVEIDILAGFAFKSAKYTNAGEDVRLLRGDNVIDRPVSDRGRPHAHRVPI